MIFTIEIVPTVEYCCDKLNLGIPPTVIYEIW